MIKLLKLSLKIENRDMQGVEGLKYLLKELKLYK